MKYLIPFVYGFSTRARTLFYKLSFLAVFVFPIWMIVIFNNGNLSYVLPRFICALIALYCVYEIGYIFNDTYTIRFEDNPTHRLNQKERIQVEKLTNLLISVRIFIVILCIIILNYIGTMNLVAFIIMLGLLDISYALHNYFRSRANIGTIFFVLIFKYGSIPILFVSLSDYFFYFCIMMFSVPVIRTIEFAAKKRYGIKKLANLDNDTFRIWYYFSTTLICSGLYLSDAKYFCALFMAIYFLLFRIICLVALKSKKISCTVDKVRKNETDTIVGGMRHAKKS